jgi:hypothetical protein
MIIISGRIRVDPDRRDDCIASSRAAMVAARTAPGCRDFVVAADPLDLSDEPRLDLTRLIPRGGHPLCILDQDGWFAEGIGPTVGF